VAGVVCLLALVCLAIGVVTQIALQHSLIGRLDAQLTAAGGRSSNVGTPPEGGVGRGNHRRGKLAAHSFCWRRAHIRWVVPHLRAIVDRTMLPPTERDRCVMVGKYERRKDAFQELTESGANTVGHIATILTGAVRDITREVGGFVTDVFEVREAAAKARADEKAISPTEAVIEDKQA
jgi:hypothetical protein